MILVFRSLYADNNNNNLKNNNNNGSLLYLSTVDQLLKLLNIQRHYFLDEKKTEAKRERM